MIFVVFGRPLFCKRFAPILSDVVCVCVIEMYTIDYITRSLVCVNCPVQWRIYHRAT